MSNKWVIGLNENTGEYSVHDEKFTTTIAEGLFYKEAALVASSPEMLAELEFAKTLFDAMPSMNAVSNRLERVINKAKGIKNGMEKD